MTDPWVAAANRANIQRAETELERARAEAARRSAPPPPRDPMDVAIDEATAALEQFMRERGPAAQALLAARRKGEYIVFGAERGIGFYNGVSFDSQGFHEGETPNHYSASPYKGSHSSNARRAVQFFAWYGEGREPDQVRDIVNWFQTRIDNIAEEQD